MTANYVLLEKITVGAAGASSVTFSSIPQTGYTDLVVKASARGTTTIGSGGHYYTISLNGSTSSRTQIFLQGDGSSASSGSSSTFTSYMDPSDYTSNTFSNFELYIPNYAGSTNKSMSVDVVTENNATSSFAAFYAQLWSSTAAITSVTLTPNAGNFAQFSTFYLYGVAKLGTTPAIVPYATGGDTIMTDGTYWYHAFLSSGTFTPAKGLSCDYLVVAGGGGSGNSSNAGGGGAGGLRSTVTATGGGGSLETAKSFASGTAYTITIGGGGGISTNGSNSSIAGTGLTTITSTGGGYGGNGGAGSAGNTGGSGGGVYNFPAFSAGSGTANQGFAGGGAIPGPPNYYAGGGGGAGAVGTVPNGGNGVQITAFATPTGTGANSGYYAGGGAGAADAGTRGTGGLGGGGTGGLPQATGSSAGVANTGGGGGAYANSGGSGIVIVRYLV